MNILDEKCKKISDSYLNLVSDIGQMGISLDRFQELNKSITQQTEDIENEVATYDNFFAYSRIGFNEEDLEEIFRVKKDVERLSIIEGETVIKRLERVKHIIVAFPDLKEKIIQSNGQLFEQLKQAILEKKVDQNQELTRRYLENARFIFNGTEYESKLDDYISGLLSEGLDLNIEVEDLDTVPKVRMAVEKLIVQSSFARNGEGLKEGYKKVKQYEDLLDLHNKIVQNIDDVTNLAIDLRVLLGDQFCIKIERIRGYKSMMDWMENVKTWREANMDPGVFTACEYLGKLRLIHGENEELAKNVYGTSFRGFLDI